MTHPKTIAAILRLHGEGKSAEEIRILTLVPLSTIRRVCKRKILVRFASRCSSSQHHQGART